MRTKGSCQFAAYYKVERYDERISVWKPIQRSFPSKELAEQFANGTGYEKTRIMHITEKGVGIMFP